MWENVQMDENNEIEQLFKDLVEIENNISIKDDESVIESPIYDEYYSSRVFDYLSYEFEQEEKGAKPRLKDPKGGLTAAGRAHFKRTEGANLKPGVKGAADTPEKMRRKGSFLTRFFTNPSGPMKDEKGRATRLALSAAAWGEPVPGDAAAAAKLAEKGRRLLERYDRTKKKNDEVEVDSKQLPGQTIGQQGSGAIGAGDSGDGVDRDGDGMIFDGTDQEQRAPYKRSSNPDYEKRRRAWVRGRLNSQGIKPHRNVQDRTTEERNARARARAEFDRRTYADGIRSQQEAARKRSINSITDSAQRVERNRGFGNVTDAGRRSLPNTPSSGERNDISKAKPDTTNIGKAKPDTTNIGKAKPDTTNIGKAKPDTTNIGKAKPDTTNIGGNRPGSELRRDGASGSGVNIGKAKPDTTNIGKAKPDTTNIGKARPSNVGPGSTSKPQSISDAATRRGQTDSRRPTSATDRPRPDSVDRGTGNRVAGDQPVRVGRQQAQGTRDAATRRGQTDSRRPTSATDRPRPDSVDRGTGNRVAGDQPVRVGRQQAQGTRDAATRRGQTDSRRPTSATDRPGADRTDRSRPNRRPDSADRQRANRGVGNTSDAATRSGQADSRRPRKNPNARPVPLPNPSPGNRGGVERPRPVPLPNPKPGDDRGRQNMPYFPRGNQRPGNNNGRQNMPYYPRGKNKPDRGTRDTRDF